MKQSSLLKQMAQCCYWGPSLLGAEFVRDRVCQGPSLSGAECVRGRNNNRLVIFPFLTLVMLNSDISSLENRVDLDQLASDKAI